MMNERVTNETHTHKIKNKIKKRGEIKSHEFARLNNFCTNNKGVTLYLSIAFFLSDHGNRKNKKKQKN